MPRALLILIWLRARGAVRRMFRRVRGWRGAVALAAGIVLLASWALPTILTALTVRSASGGRTFAIRSAPPGTVLEYGPVVLMAICLLPLLTGHTQAVAFLPAEIEFLFGGPFTRRQLLAYKVLINALGAAAMSVFIALWLWSLAGHWSAPYPVAFCSLLLTQLVGMVIALVGSVVGQRILVTARRGVFVALLIGAGAIAWVLLGGPGSGAAQEPWTDTFARIRNSVPAAVILAPFEVFIRMLISPTPAGVAAWGLGALAINAVLFALVVRLDRHATDAAIHASERLAEMRERMRRGPGAAAGNWFGARWTIPWPQPPQGWLGGAGPLAWRQATGCLRGAPGWVLATAIMLAAVLGFGLWTRLGRPLPPDVMSIVGVQVVVMLTIFQTTLLRFDFRADLDRMESLKALPLHPLSVAAGQLAAPVIFMTASQWLLVAAGVTLFPTQALMFLAAGAAAPGVNILLIGVENYMFLLYPTRPPTGPVIEIQRIGRGTFITLAKFLVVLLAGGTVAAFGGAAFWASGGSWTAAVVVAWLTLAVVASLVVAAVAGAFKRFDVSRDVG
jgi:hypothetical protein